MNFNELLKKISPTTFAEVMEIAPRKVRESLYSHYGIKNKSRGLLSSLKNKKENRIKNLHLALQEAYKPREQEFLKELFRNWLFHQRPLLKATLDYLKVENDNGLVETETDFFKELNETQVQELIEFLKPNFSHEAILIYLSFMEVPKIENYF
ncbi:MAG: hypothetical protein H6731_09910 [Myxococcales bacterium]|nr:MAG: hypothetical protein H6731_09910 [Myxococcales bacterium]